MASAPLLDDNELQKIYVWVDSVPLTRPKRNIARDFSDGVLVAELVHHYFPKLVELHNYSAANSVRQKLYNWATLNQRVLKRIDFEVKRPDVEAIVNCKPGIIEAVLMQLQQKIADYRAHRTSSSLGEMTSPGNYDSANSSSAQGAGRSADANSSEPSFSSYGAAARAAHPPPQDQNQLLSSSSFTSGASSVVQSSTSNRGLEHYGGGGGGISADAGAAIAERDSTIAELRDTLEILELKVKKLEQLVRLKDSRIQTLTARLQQGLSS